MLRRERPGYRRGCARGDAEQRRGDQSRAVPGGGITYRTLGIPKVDALAGAGVPFRRPSASSGDGGQRGVRGGGRQLGRPAAVHLSKSPAGYTMRAAGSRLDVRLSPKEIEATRNITVHMYTEVVDALGDHVLEGFVRDRRRDAPGAGGGALSSSGRPAHLCPRRASRTQGYVVTATPRHNGWSRESWPPSGCRCPGDERPACSCRRRPPMVRSTHRLGRRRGSADPLRA